MKHYLRLMGQQCPLSNLYKTKFSAMLAVTTLFMCLIAAIQAPAQTGAAAKLDEIKPLQIGDTIPAELWHLPLQVVNHPEGKETITLNDYRDSELLLLEFWGFPCSGCIQTVNKLDSIKDGFETNQFTVLPIHILPFDYDETRMLELVEGAIQRNEWSLPSVVKDTALYSLFGRYLPDWGDVWISHGRLLAVPTHGYINVETIASVLNDAFGDFQNRYNLLPINPYQPLLANGNGSGDVLHQSVHGIVTGHIPHQNAMRFKFERRGDSTFLYAWNRSLPELLYEAYKLDIMEHLTIETGIKWETHSIDTNLLWEGDSKLLPVDQVLKRESWNAKNLYGYQLRVPGIITEKEGRRLMQRDMEGFAQSYLGVQPKLTNYGPYRYAVLEVSDSNIASEIIVDKYKQRRIAHSESSYKFYNYPFNIFIRNITRALTQTHGLQLTFNNVVNRTGMSDDTLVSFTFDKQKLDSGDFQQLQEVLGPYGMKLTIKERKVPILLVQDIKY